MEKMKRAGSSSEPAHLVTSVCPLFRGYRRFTFLPYMGSLLGQTNGIGLS